MRQFLFLIILFFSSHLIDAQTYVPFPTDSARWKVTYYSGALGCPNIVSEYQYTIDGDTLISSTTYQKIFRTGYTNNSFCYFGPFGYSGCIREDGNKHIYLRLPSSNSDTLLYDFSLNVGDTVQSFLNYCTVPITVISIDSILIQSSYRKRFNLDGGCQANSVSLIEGIGSTHGLLDATSSFESAGHLDCFTLNGQTIFPDTISNCPLLVASISTATKNECFPKLIEKSIQQAHYKMDCSYTGKIRISGYDLIGRELFHDEINSDEIFIPLQENQPMILHFEWGNETYTSILVN